MQAGTIVLIVYSVLVSLFILGFVIYTLLRTGGIHLQETVVGSEVQHVTFAAGDRVHFANAHACARRALLLGVKGSLILSPSDVQEAYTNAYPKALNPETQRGFGFWRWKPLVLQHVIASAEETPWVLYTDAGVLVKNLRAIIQRAERANCDVLRFDNSHNNRSHMSAECADALGVTEAEMEEIQINSAVLLVRRNAAVRTLLRRWVDEMRNPHAVEDPDGKQGQHADFRDHRHDQAVLSVLMSRMETADELNVKRLSVAEYGWYIHQHRSRTMLGSSFMC